MINLDKQNRHLIDSWLMCILLLEIVSSRLPDDCTTEIIVRPIIMLYQNKQLCLTILTLCLVNCFLPTNEELSRHTLTSDKSDN